MAKKQRRMVSRWRRALPMAAISGVVGLGAGLTIASFVGAMGGRFFGGLPFYFALVTATAGWLYGALVMEGTADVMKRLYLGSEVGSRREFSHAQAMAARGDYEAALEVYEAAADEFPDDPHPLILGARVLRDGLEDPRTAARWLKRAREIKGVEPSEMITIAQELVDLYDGPLEEQRAALPLLARIAEEFGGTSAGEWAGRRLARLRTEVWEDIKEPDVPPPEPRKPPPNPDPTI